MNARAVDGLQPEEIPDVEVLTDEECWMLLTHETIGRVAVRRGEGVDIFPVNFTSKNGDVFIRSAPGSKLIDITSQPAVAFEVDGTGRHTHWSVVLKGQAERMSSDADIHSSGVLGLQTLTSSAKWNYVRIVGGEISGRRFRTHPL